MTFKDFRDKAFTEIFSMKYQLVFISCLFFYIGKLSESGWITFVLSITGIRVVNEVAGMAKDIYSAQSELRRFASKGTPNAPVINKE